MDWFSKGASTPYGGGLYLEATERFMHSALPDLSRCLKANCNDAGVVVLYED